MTHTCPYCATRQAVAFAPCVCAVCGVELKPRPSVARLVFMLQVARERIASRVKEVNCE